MIASFHILRRADLAGLIEVAAKRGTDDDGPSTSDYLDAHEYRRDDTSDRFSWSGYVMFYLLLGLEEAGIELGSGAYQDEDRILSQAMDEIHLLTSADRVHLPALRAARADPDHLVLFLEKNAYGFPEIAEAIDEGLETLDELISLLTDEDVLIISIG